MSHNKNVKSKMKESSTSGIHAAALQDHLSRSLKLDLHVHQSYRRNRTTKGSGSAIRNAGQKIMESNGKNVANNTSTTNNMTDQMYSTYQDAWTCEICTLFNRSGLRCAACGTSKKSQMEKEKSESETLAQKLGIVPKGPKKLTDEEWNKIESESERRRDSYEPCAICRQPFGIDQQVILSCSHVFHKGCLESFEKFIRSADRCCPLCRTAAYEKRTVSHGEKAHREICALKIQSFFRGYRCRKVFWKMLGDYYKQGFGDPLLRKAYFARELNQVSTRWMKTVQAQDDSLNMLFKDIESSLKISREVFGERKTTSDQDWLHLLDKAKAREGDCSECPICMNDIPISTFVSVTSPTATDIPSVRLCVILTCSHVYHAQCIESFEKFNIDKGDRCPMCRTMYTEKRIVYS